MARDLASYLAELAARDAAKAAAGLSGVVTPGGAEVATVGQAAARRLAAAPDPDGVAARDRVYRELWGEPGAIARDETSFAPKVDVLAFGPTDERDFFTLVTSGMSDLPMATPAELGRDARRVELVLYVDEPFVEAFELMRALAKLPHATSAWLGSGHTVPNGSPPAPIASGSDLSVALFLATPMKPDAHLVERLRIDRDPVRLLWVVPISEGECALKLERGTSALLELFDEHEHSFVLDPTRRSYL